MRSSRKIKQRVYFPDATRGLAMFSVVMGHISMFCLDLYSESLILQYVGLLLPGLSLFMMISGYFTNPEKVNIQKRFKLLIPFFIFGLLYSYLCTDFDAKDFIMDRCKNGYWFLFEIFVFNLFVWFITKIKSPIGITIAIIELCAIVAYFVFMRHTPVADLIGLYYWCTFLPFFYLGIRLRSITIEQLYMYRKNVFFTCIVVIILLLFLRHYMADNYWPFHILGLLISLPICISLFLLLYIAEKKYKDKKSFLKQWIKNCGSHIGQYTLEIYVLHYFVMYLLNCLHIKSITAFMTNTNCLWLELLIVPFVAFVTCYICIGFAKLCEHLKLSILFGK